MIVEKNSGPEPEPESKTSEYNIPTKKVHFTPIFEKRKDSKYMANLKRMYTGHSPNTNTTRKPMPNFLPQKSLREQIKERMKEKAIDQTPKIAKPAVVKTKPRVIELDSSVSDLSRLEVTPK